MRTLALALTAASLTLPALPSAAVARSGYYQGRTWQDAQGRTRCKRSNGTTGLIVGAGAGALIGHSIDNSRSGTVGTILGAITPLGGLSGVTPAEGSANLINVRALLLGEESLRQQDDEDAER